MLSRITNAAVLIFITMSLIYGIYITGYKTAIADNKPTSDFVTFSDYKSDYRLHKDTVYRTEHILDGTDEYYFIYLEAGNGRIVVEYEDTNINGEFVSAESWKDSFIMCLMSEEERIMYLGGLK